ncbi:hypothetical protein B0T10DRAFT_488654 [Thelonectria olida]|uniref:Secreted protein n=1 Tax=Thelonectria olida TaxID=1576542 RepID=A0A9P9API6_9HYPO|nr:hypothetical protein B0T10DRAFT_488654 [Thelonectria olida]
MLSPCLRITMTGSSVRLECWHLFLVSLSLGGSGCFVCQDSAIPPQDLRLQPAVAYAPRWTKNSFVSPNTPRPANSPRSPGPQFPNQISCNMLVK